MKKTTKLLFFNYLSSFSLLFALNIYPQVLQSITAQLQSESLVVSCVYFLIGLLFLVKMLEGFFNTCCIIAKNTLSSQLAFDISTTLLKRVFLTTPQFFINNEPERITERISRDSQLVAEKRVELLVSFPFVVFKFALSILIMFCGTEYILHKLPILTHFGFSTLHGNTTLGAIIILLSPLNFIHILMQKKYALFERNNCESQELEKFTTTETIRGISDIRSNNAFEFFMRRILRIGNIALSNKNKLLICSSSFGLATTIAQGFIETALLFITAKLIVAPELTFTFADYMGFASLNVLFISSIQDLSSVVETIVRTRQAGIRIQNLHHLPAPFSKGKTSMILPHDQLIFKDVSFKTNGATLLSNINLLIQPGEHIAITGPSGCGKTTLLKHCIRHLDPSNGTLYYGKQPISNIDFATLTQRIAYVNQKPFIFQGTIRENIAFGRTIENIDDKILTLAKDIALYDDLMEKDKDISKALSYEVRQGGEGLSGGQIAKIALLRALIGEPKILLLDEVTSSLDEISQNAVLSFISNKCKDTTILSISHRLPAIKAMHRIIVMQSGRIVQDGSYQELRSRPGLFSLIEAREMNTSPSFSTQNLNFDNSLEANVQTLSLCALFSGLSTKELQTIATGCLEVKYKSGEIIIHQGDLGSSMFIVKSGIVSVRSATYGAGYSFGEVALFADTRRTANVVAMSDCSVIRIEQETIKDACARNGTLSLRLLSSVAKIASRESK